MPFKKHEIIRWPYFAPFEVVIHNISDDCWVSFLGKVFDVSDVILEHRHEQCSKPLIAMAGKDISHWFDPNTGDIQFRIHPVTGNQVPYLPHGRIPDVPVEVPDSNWRPEHKPWWKNEKFQIGLLTKKVRPIRIINMLIFKEVHLNVCSEDTFYRIAERYSIFCKDTDSYLWKHNNRRINMYKTLDENGIFDETERFSDAGLPPNFYIPSILLYYEGDFKHLSDDTDSADECGLDVVDERDYLAIFSGPSNILPYDTMLDSYAKYLQGESFVEEYSPLLHKAPLESKPAIDDNITKGYTQKTEAYLEDIVKHQLAEFDNEEGSAAVVPMPADQSAYKEESEMVAKHVLKDIMEDATIMEDASIMEDSEHEDAVENKDIVEDEHIEEKGVAGENENIVEDTVETENIVQKEEPPETQDAPVIEKENVPEETDN